MKPERTRKDAYRAALDDVLIVRHPTPGLIPVKGSDRLDLLHRMSTNDVADLPPGALRLTVLTTAIGRVVDVISVLALPDRALLITTPSRAPLVRNWLQRHIFFQDEVTLDEPPQGWTHWGLYGPKAAVEVERVIPSATDVKTGFAASVDGGLAWEVEAPIRGYRLLLDGEHQAPTGDAWEGWEDGAAAAYEILRVEAGSPAFGSEITEDSIPLEVGLREAVSFSKGCYIGQEIIARMESRARLAKRLIGVRLEGPAEVEAPLRQGNRTVGTLTSVVESPRLGWIALASVKPEALEKDSGRVTVGDEDKPAHLVEVPFHIEPIKG